MDSFFVCVSPSSFRDSERRTEKHLKMMVCVCLFCISENEATQLQSLSFCWFLKVLVLVLWNTPSWAQQPAWHCAVGCEVEAIEHWISPVYLRGRTPCAKCVCAVPLRKFNVQHSSSFSFHTYGEEAQWLPVEFHCEVHTDGLVQGSLKGTQGKKFLLIFPIWRVFLPF